MKKVLIASLLAAAFAGTAFAQAPAPAAPAKPAAKAAPGKAPAKAVSRREAIEVSTPLEENDPADKLSPAELAVAKRVFTGQIQCELGAHVKVTPRRREGYFLVSHGINRFVMHPVESKTGAIRLEDPARGALWLQLGNKSMLMNQKEGKRLADECISPEQAQFALEMKNRPPVNLLEPEPAKPAQPPAQ
jgi:Ni/Co efflux regulator RcnB